MEKAYQPAEVEDRLYAKWLEDGCFSAKKDLDKEAKDKYAQELKQKRKEIVAGKFKCPMMRGLMDTRITEHHELTDKVAEDLDSWLCNVYFEIGRTPRSV